MLEEGLKVITTVRKKSRDKYANLIEIEKNKNGTIEIFEADLLQECSFDLAMKDCELAIHTASLFFISGFKDIQKEHIEPAKMGTRNVLISAYRIKTLKQVVV